MAAAESFSVREKARVEKELKEKLLKLEEKYIKLLKPKYNIMHNTL